MNGFDVRHVEFLIERGADIRHVSECVADPSFRMSGSLTEEEFSRSVQRVRGLLASSFALSALVELRLIAEALLPDSKEPDWFRPWV